MQCSVVFENHKVWHKAAWFKSQLLYHLQICCECITFLHCKMEVIIELTSCGCLEENLEE
jgi:hypothetical protein